MVQFDIDPGIRRQLVPLDCPGQGDSVGGMVDRGQEGPRNVDLWHLHIDGNTVRVVVGPTVPPGGDEAQAQSLAGDRGNPITQAGDCPVVSSGAGVHGGDVLQDGFAPHQFQMHPFPGISYSFPLN